MKHFLPIVLTALFYLSSPVFAMEIGVVDLNEALNQSEAGIRSKIILERRGRQKQQEVKLEQEMRAEERRLTEVIFQELKTVIRSISIKEKLDLVLEKNAAQIILYMKQDTTDMTQKVIDAYNSLKQTGGD